VAIRRSSVGGRASERASEREKQQRTSERASERTFATPDGREEKRNEHVSPLKSLGLANGSERGKGERQGREYGGEIAKYVVEMGWRMNAAARRLAILSIFFPASGRLIKRTARLWPAILGHDGVAA